MKKIPFSILAVVMLAACSPKIAPEKYIASMVALGCKNLTETAPGAEAVLQEQGVTLRDLQRYRKKMDPKFSMQNAMEIARKVMECHGVQMQSLPPQLPQQAPAPAK